MTLAAIHDAIAAKLGALSGIELTYGDGSVDPNVLPSPQSVQTMPAVLVRIGSDQRTMGLSRELFRTQWEADFYVPLASDVEGTAIRYINQLRDEMRIEMRQGISLGGLVTVCRYLGSNAPVKRDEGQDEAVISYLIWTVRLETEERTAVAPTV